MKTRDLTVSDIAQLQELQIKLLSRFVVICKAHNLSYFAYYGTLLGAVRHNTHIPWDDDIDIAMPRKDFNEFLRLAKAANDKCFKLWWLSTDKSYPFNFAKVIGKRDARFINTYPNLPDKYNGPRIDIFPLDSVGMRWRRIFFLVKALEKIGKQEKNLQKICKLKLPILSKIMLHYMLTLTSANPLAGHYISFFSVYDKEKEHIPKSDFFMQASDPCYMPFGLINVRVPINYKCILTRIYGDYLQCPPENERQTARHYLKRVI